MRAHGLCSPKAYNVQFNYYSYGELGYRNKLKSHCLFFHMNVIDYITLHLTVI